MATKPMHEISRKLISSNRNVDVSMIWHDSVLAVRTDKVLHLFELSSDLNNLDKKLEFTETSVHVHKSNTTVCIFESQFWKKSLRNVDLAHMILDTSLWSHNPYLVQELNNITTVAWSPSGFIFRNDFSLAILNSVGNVDIFGPDKFIWKNILNFSTHIEQCLMSTLPSNILNAHPDNLQQVRSALNTLKTSAICWSPCLKTNNMCYFITALKNSKILFWLLQSNELDIKVELKFDFQIDCDEIVSLLWIPKIENEFLLVCSTVTGQILALSLRIKNDEIIHSGSNLLWMDKDRMVAQHFCYRIIGDKTVLACSKHRHLLVQVLDKDCKVLTQNIFNVNDYKITVITHSNNEFYLGTVNFKIYNIDIKLHNEELSVRLNSVDVKISVPSPTYELYGFSVSSSGAIFALLLMDRRVLHRKIGLHFEIVFVCSNSEHQTEIELLLNNPSKSLASAWDCVEMLRFKTMKLKKLPAIDYNQLYQQSCTDIYKMKIYLILLTFYNSLNKILKNHSKGILPETNIHLVKETILALHASMLVKKYSEILNNKENVLTNFEIECLVGAEKYLKYYCKQYNRNISDFVYDNDLKLCQFKCHYSCQCCEEELIWMSCKNGHLNMFCFLTFTPIESEDYLICKNCGFTARIELWERRPLCLYCDFQLKNSYVLS